MRRAVVQRAQHWPASTRGLAIRLAGGAATRSAHGGGPCSMATVASAWPAREAEGQYQARADAAAGSRARRPRSASTARHSGSAAWRPCSAKARHRQQRCPPRRRGPRWQVALLEHVTGLVTRAAVLQSEITPPPTPRARVPLAEAFLAPLRGRRESVRPQAQGRAAVGGGGPRVGVLDVPRSSQVARGAVQKV